MPNFRKLSGTTQSELWIAKESATGSFSGMYFENTTGTNLDIREPSGGAGGTLANITIATPTAGGHAATKAYADGLVGGVDQQKWIAFTIASPAAGVVTSSTAEIPAGGLVTGCRIEVTQAYDDTGVKTVTVGMGTATAITEVADVNLQQLDLYIVDQMNVNTGIAHAVEATISAGNTDGTTGTATIWVSYVETPAP